MMQRNRAYSNRIKQSKIKAKRQRSQTTEQAVPKIFNKVGEIIKCPSIKTKCKAFQRIVYCLKLYNKFLSQYNTSYHEQTLLLSSSNPTTPLSASPSTSSSFGSSPFDIDTESNLIPSKNIKTKKKKSSKKIRMNGKRSPKSQQIKSSFYALYRNKCGEYNNIDLLNDLNHLTQEHDLHELSDYILNQFNVKSIECNVRTCISLKRMYRDRFKCCKENRFRQMLYLGHYDPNEVITQQIMDRIHNYLLHTYDIGMKLHPNEIETKVNDDDEGYKDDTLNKMNEIIISKRNVLQELIGNKYLTKFTSIIDVTSDNDNHGANGGRYSPRYYYWSVYSDWDNDDKSNPGYNYCDWFVSAKHSSLKHELLLLPLLSAEQWNDMMALCGIYKQCRAIKMIKADFDDLHGYGIKRYTPIQTQHLLSILIYCNFESIRKRFCQTFVRIPSQEEDHHLMERHARFANFARLLRESVEVFGQRTLFSKVNRFYHCLDKEFMFRERSGYFNAPISTSIHYETVINLNKKSGVILQFADNNDTHINGGLRYFDTSLLSDYIYEYEMLFISSLSPLYIETIIQCNLGHNYGYFIHSLDVLYQMMRAQRYKNVMNDKKDELYKMNANKLIKHQLFKNNYLKKEYQNVPKYIDNLLDYFFLNTTVINIDYEHLISQFKIFSSLFIAKESYIKLDVLLVLFPNCRHITINAIKARLVFNDEAFESILKVLSSPDYMNSNIQEIVLKEALSHSFCPSIAKFENMFIESRWFITQQNSNLIFKQSTYDVV